MTDLKDLIEPEDPNKPGAAPAGADPIKPVSLADLANRVGVGPDAKRIVDNLNQLGGMGKHIQEQMKEFARSKPHLRGVEAMLSDQREKIDRMARPFDMPRIDVSEAIRNIPPNPAHETNARLEQIEGRFEDLLEIASKAADIVTVLQTHAIVFIEQFKDAAESTNRSARTAIIISATAVVLTVAQFAYTEMWRAPADAENVATVAADMRREIANVAKAQQDVAERIAQALAERTDQREVVRALEQIQRTLVEQGKAAKGDGASTAQ